ncbi:TetR/AcrR family transcriptional regulator [Paenibacillus methanolicus]|uniref:AcrR family transcriptional regulator n=1 Tax=Paenibacillus methanolicus TaxID=582686 RepID=A0A5S5BWZ1_9BACL|nr:TetR/AcrR family transcriptional regulator [Paenibacillus methanolicus]TYP70816.1 AcrR family transcriptional regulator [Paenibacillus methanolicus]
MTSGNDELGAQILRKAQGLFAEHGVEAVSMHQVAKAAGVGQGTLYRRYPSKSNLCMSIMQSKIDGFIDEVSAYLAAHAEAPALERLSGIMTKQILFCHADVAWMKELFRSGKLKDMKVNPFELPPFVFMVGAIRQLLEEAAAKGELLSVDPAFTASLIAASLSPELLVHFDDKGYTGEQIAAHYVRSFIAPLFPARPS